MFCTCHKRWEGSARQVSDPFSLSDSPDRVALAFHGRRNSSTCASEKAPCGGQQEWRFTSHFQLRRQLHTFLQLNAITISTHHFRLSAILTIIKVGYRQPSDFPLPFATSHLTQPTSSPRKPYSTKYPFAQPLIYSILHHASKIRRPRSRGRPRH